MGACFDTVKLPACTEKELTKKFSAHQDFMCHEHGEDTYAGHIGIVNGLSVSSQVFKSDSDAQKWLESNAQKWDPALAVRVGDFSKVFPSTAAEKKLNDTYLQLLSEVENWDAAIIKRVKQSKSLFRGCEACNSKVAVKYIKTIGCPVCGTFKFLKTATDDKKFVALEAKVKEVRTKVETAKKKYVEAQKSTYWLVGAWCAS